MAKKSASTKPEPSFEQVMERLETIVEQLDEGELALEHSLAAFEEGVGLARQAQASLDAMERRVEQLTEQGTLEKFEESDDDA